MPPSPAYAPEPRFDALGPDFADMVRPARFPDAVLRRRDQRAAAQVGLETLSAQEWRAHFADFAPLPGNLKTPLAMRYHGHQFRAYNPDIGDGRGFLFAQLRDARGRLLDIATKGSGQTPWSRTGDGRMTLQGGVREALASAYLRASGVPGCAVLSLYETGEDLQRHDEPAPARGAVMARLQYSHVRIGTFQRHAYEDSPERVRALMEHAVAVYYPQLAEVSDDARPAAFLRQACAANAKLVGRWMAAGFVHGVLNSDNMTVTGESFDYGPSRFLPVYEPSFTAAYFDQTGIYAYARQAEATLWNLHRLAECLALIAPGEALTEALTAFEPAYHDALGASFCARLGVARAGVEADLALVGAVYRFLRSSRAPFEGFFFDWFGGPAAADQARAGPRARYYRHADFAPLEAALRARPPICDAARAHPYFDADHPLTMTIADVRAVWAAIDEADDWRAFDEALARCDAMADAFGLDASVDLKA